MSYPRWILSYRADTEGLAVFRIAFALHGLLFHLPSFTWVGAAPPAFFHPPTFSFAAALHSQAPATLLYVLTLGLITSYCCLLFGYRTRTAALTAASLMVTGLTLYYSFGKIGHGLVFHLSTLVLLAFSPWGRAFSLDAKLRPAPDKPDEVWGRSWPVALLALLIGFGYLSAGIPKALSWVDFDLTTHGARAWLVVGYAEQGRTALLASSAMQVESRWIWEAADYLAVSFEVSIFAAAILGPYAFRWLLAIAATFHIINQLILNIDFTSIFIVFTLFIPYKNARNRLRSIGINHYLSQFLMQRSALLCFILISCITFLLCSYASEHPLHSAGLLPVAHSFGIGPFWLLTIFNVVYAGVLVAFSWPLTPEPAGTS